MMRLPLKDKNDITSINYDEVCQMVDKFLEEGYTYFDTAYMYHNYVSEICVRECLVKRHDRNKFLLADKLPTMQLKSKEDNERIFNEQLNKCGVDYFDYYLLHCLNVKNIEISEKCDSFNFVKRLKEEGKIKNVGFSFHDTHEVLDSILTKYDFFDFVQLQLNYLDWENPDVQSRLCYEVAKKHNKKIIVMESIKGGKLANLPDEASKLMKDYDPKSSVASWAMRYVASIDETIVCLSGMSNYEQLLDNVTYMNDFKKLNEEEYEIINKVTTILNNNELIACTDCKYCVEGCPKNIAIPEYFKLYNIVKEKGWRTEFNSQKEKFDELAKTYGLPSACVNCKKCEAHCPQHLKITDNLVKVKGMFER
jgi:predicted aldo/keto reductase-like oxidoreductase